MRRFAVAAIMAVLSGASGAFAQELPCGGSYTVAPGDTLAIIAQKHYGNVKSFRLIHDRNRDVIGPSPDAIEIGQVYVIPCEGDAVAADAGAGESAQAPVETAANRLEIPPSATPARQGPRPDLLLLTSDGQQPLVSSDLPGGGLYTELVTRALGRAAPELDFDVVYMKERPARMEDLQAAAGFDLGFPWIRPDCAEGARLSDAMRARCAQFEFSDPFFEVRIGYFTGPQSDYAAATGAEELFGARICRPRSLFTGDLEAVDLVEPNISMVTADTLDYCLQALRFGEVDVVTADVSQVKAALERLGYTRSMVELEPLSNAQTLRVAGPRGLRSTRIAIAALNAGLKRMRDTGEWFEVISRHAALGANPSTPTN